MVDQLKRLRRETTRINALIEKDSEKVDPEMALILDTNALSAAADREPSASKSSRTLNILLSP